MTRKKQDTETAAAEPEGKEAAAQTVAAAEPGAPVASGRRYRLQVSRNGSDWADVAHCTVAVASDQRDLMQAPVGYSFDEASKVAKDWKRSGYDVRLGELTD